MAVLKYKSGGEVKTLGVVKSGTSVVSGVSSVNGKTGVITGVYDTNNQPPYPVRSVNGITGDVNIDIQSIKTVVLTFTFSSEDAAHICSTSIVNNVNKVLDIIPYIAKCFRGGIKYENGYLITSFLNSNGAIYTQSVECRVIYYE